METEAITMISNYGFPIFLCLWFMFRMEKVIKNNTEVLNKIMGVIKLNGRSKERRRS